jgi:hypothetical protein
MGGSVESRVGWGIDEGKEVGVEEVVLGFGWEVVVDLCEPGNWGQWGVWITAKERTVSLVLSPSSCVIPDNSLLWSSFGGR